VYNTELALDAGQPGTSGVTALPGPDLSNPAGGAYEAQHFAYIIQWYLFAFLALAAPFAMGRAELRHARRQFLGIDTGDEEFGLAADAGPPQLTAGTPPGAMPAVRAGGGLVRQDGPTPRQWQRAERLADRYGRSLGIESSTSGRAAAIVRGQTHSDDPRSQDAYQGSYNDQLWLLAMADGALPDPVLTTPHDLDDPPAP
jgi:hypothetical protein